MTTVDLINLAASLVSIGGLLVVVSRKLPKNQSLPHLIRAFLRRPELRSLAATLRWLGLTLASNFGSVSAWTTRWHRLRLQPKRLLGYAVVAGIILIAFAPTLYRRHQISTVASDVAALLADGHAFEADALLQARLDAYGDQPRLLKLAGDVRCATKDYEACAVRYRQAGAAGYSLADDREFLRNLPALLAKRHCEEPLTALFAADDRAAQAALGPLVKSQSRDVRHAAAALLEKAGRQKDIDYVELYTLDLLSARSCRDRRESAHRLGSTHDKRAVPGLKEARARFGTGFFDRLCAGKDIDAALEAVEGTSAQDNAQAGS